MIFICTILSIFNMDITMPFNPIFIDAKTGQKFGNDQTLKRILYDPNCSPRGAQIAKVPLFASSKYTFG